ncbi:hypothetical protein BJV74DRAFT_812265 [Russula compacta]|nr:hypothetical protein BJV74DRAFT_812265 [Russula compacta]
MLSTQGTSQRPQRPSIHVNPVPPLPDLYTDARLHGYQGPTRTVRLPGAVSSGGGAIAKSEDGERCVVAGKECLRILRLSDTQTSLNPDHKSSVGRGGHRIDASRNLWSGGGLKTESVSTDVAWGRGSYDNKILTSARNGELIMWDLNKLGPSKYERRTRLHLRSIHVLAYSPIVANYCMTGSADGDIRVWDLRDMRNSVIRLHHPTAVRTAAFSCSQVCPVHAVVGLDNGSLYKYDFSMGSKGQLDRFPVAHTGPILTLDWCAPDGGVPGAGGWIASGSLDRTVKVWDISGSHFVRTATYTIATQFPVRRVRWRPGYECELAVASNAEFGIGSMSEVSDPDPEKPEEAPTNVKRRTDIGDAVEIWDVRRGHIAKWQVGGSAIEGGVTDIEFRDSHALWAQHSSGTFAQLDLRNSYRPLDAVPRLAVSWAASHSLTFVADKKTPWEVPYDDIDPKTRLSALGNKPFKPVVQSVGTHVFNSSHQDSDRFSVLAKGYVVDGSDKVTICEINAQIALHADHHQVFQMWCLLGSLFAPAPVTPDISRPQTPSLSPLPLSSRILPHSRSAPAAIPTSSSVPSQSDPFPPPNTPRGLSSESMLSSHAPYTTAGDSPHPVSPSTSPSPQRVSNPTQVISSPQSVLSTPSTTPARSPSIVPRRTPSASLLANRSRALSSLQWPSTANSSGPGDNSSSPSLRHVGEGTLDDSDSSGSESDLSSLPSASAISPVAQALSRTAYPITQSHSSPLSRIAAAGHQTWTEDEREVDDDSPSPASSETESDFETAPARTRARARSQSLRRRVARRGSVSATRVAVAVGSTQAATGAAAAAVSPLVLARPGSRSSMRTVTAHDDGGGEHEPFLPPPARPTSASRVASVGKSVSDGLYGSGAGADCDASSSSLLNAQDVYMRNSVRRRVEDALEERAEVGDVQTCAMMALVASEALRIGTRRVQLFVEAYIELLMRMKLYITAAYLRKHSVLPDIRSATNLQTTVYMSCGRCGKPILAQQGGSMCATCRSPAAQCSICHLPVKSMLFQCAVCSHGGHQACYRRFYAEMPLVHLPAPQSPSSAGSSLKFSAPRVCRSTSRSKDRGCDDAIDIAVPDYAIDASAVVAPSPRQLMGHSCAAGCGHFCWVANFKEEETRNKRVR